MNYRGAGVRTGLAGAVALALYGCGGTGQLPGVELTALAAGSGGRSAKRSVQQSHPAEHVTRVRVETPNGELRTQPADAGTVTLDATVTASGRRSEDQLRQWAEKVEIRADRDGGTLRIHPILPKGRPRDVGFAVSFVLRVPPSAALLLQTGNGAVSAGGTSADVTVESGNGEIRLSDIRGKLRGRTGNGAVRIERVQGDVTAETGNGAIELQRIEGDAHARTGSGGVRVKELAGGEDTRLETGSGDIEFSGTSAALSAHTANGAVRAALTAMPRETSLHSGNGDLEAALPSPADAEIDAQTGNGRVDARELKQTPENVRVPDAQDRGKWRGRLGTGRAQLTLRTMNGSVRIRQR